MTISRDLRETGTVALLSGALFASGVVLPLVGPLLGFVASAPLMWLAARRGARVASVAALLGTALLLPALPPPAVLFYVAEHALPALFLGARIARGAGIVAGGAIAACAVTALLLGVGFLSAGASGVDPAAVFQQQLNTVLGELEQAGKPLTEGAGAAAAAEFQALLGFFGRVFPALMLVGIFLEISANAVLAARILARETPPAAPLPAYTAFHVPERLIWALLPALAFVWWPRREVATAALNALIPLLTLYLIQGLSITLHLLARLRLSRFGRLLLSLALLFQPYLLAGPLLLGLLDFRFDFRRRWPILPPTTPASPPAA